MTEPLDCKRKETKKKKRKQTISTSDIDSLLRDYCIPDRECTLFDETSEDVFESESLREEYLENVCKDETDNECHQNPSGKEDEIKDCVIPGQQNEETNNALNDVVDKVEDMYLSSVTENTKIEQIYEETSSQQQVPVHLDRELQRENDILLSLEHKIVQMKPFTEAEMASIYFNNQLHMREQFMNTFVQNELHSGNVTLHPLYELLTNYLKSKDQLTKNSLDFEFLINNYKQYQEQLWYLESSACTEYGECQDGNGVSATYRFKVSSFNEFAFTNLQRTVQNLQDFVNKEYALNVFNCEFLKMKIESYIRVLSDYFAFSSEDVCLRLDSTPVHPFRSSSVDTTFYRHIFIEDINLAIIDLKNAISVLFNFKRRIIKDVAFENESLSWLERLVGILLRIATPNDHLFLLNHVLRCPSGIDKWACNFIQIPINIAGLGISYQRSLDHAITVLATLMLPILSRESFLELIENVDEKVWVIVDEDGEDSIDESLPKTALKEDDLVTLLNQIPFGYIFRQIILVTAHNGEWIYDVNSITERDMLKGIIVSNIIVTLLEKGMDSYSSGTYKQFCKRLSRLIIHTALYVTDHWQMFREVYITRGVVDVDTLLRIQTEYDAFMLRVAEILYGSRERLSWQYLATLPFTMITTHTLWRLYQYLLRTTIDSNTSASEEFINALGNMADNDIYYLLTTITNMALARQIQDWLFIQTVASQIFQVGFVNISSRDCCRKPARVLLANLTYKYPSLISDILSKLKISFALVGKLSLYLFKELAIFHWRLSNADIFTLSDWLINYPLNSCESNLARYIITHLNWSIDICTNNLFLPRNVHCQIAMTIVKTVNQHSEIVKSPTYISQSVKQVSTLVSTLQTPEQTFVDWAWQILSRLRIHAADQPSYTPGNEASMASIPDINSDTEDMKILWKGICDNECISCYVGLLMTNAGHSMPIICDIGWKCCMELLNSQKYTQVIHVLQMTLPNFVEFTHGLVSNESFHEIMISLLSADLTYMKMARSLITNDFPGVVLSQLSDVIHYHVQNYSRYGFENNVKMMEFWFNLLKWLWNTNYSSVVYLMNTLLQYSLIDSNIKQLSINTLSSLIQDISGEQSPSSGLSSWIGWMSSGGEKGKSTILSSLLPRRSQSVIHSPIFAYFALHLEQYYTQDENHLWNEVLINLAQSSGKANIEQTVRKASTLLNLSGINANSLSIYRWSQYAIDLPVDQPLLPLFWQRFFMLYLQRVPGSIDRGCVGAKFFEGTVNHNYFKKVKNKLQICFDYFTTMAIKSLEPKRSLYVQLTKLYETYLVWLEKRIFQEVGLFLPGLPAIYNPQKLSKIIEGDQAMWMEYVDMDEMNKFQRNALTNWLKVLGRNQTSATRRIICVPEDSNPLKKMMERLESYDDPLPPPKIIRKPLFIRSPSSDTMLNNKLFNDYIAEYIEYVQQFTQSHKITKNGQSNISLQLLEASRKLYTDIELEIPMFAACDASECIPKRRNAIRITCAGPALLKIKVLEARCNQSAKYTVEKSDGEFQSSLNESIREPPFNLCVSCADIEVAIKTLCDEKEEIHKSGDVNLLPAICEVGVVMFYKLLSLYKGDASEYFPVKKLLCKIIGNLGKTFIEGTEYECPKLLSALMEWPELKEVLLVHFTPNCASTSTFIQLYQIVVESIPTNVSIELLTLIIEKFDIPDWLNKRKPLLKERSKFIEITSKSLKEMGRQLPAHILPLHKAIRMNLCQMLIYEFPEHYGEILHVVLKYTQQEKLANEVWMEIINALMIATSGGVTLPPSSNNASFNTNMTLGQISEVAKKYAIQQRVLTYIELVETANMLSGTFLKERMQYGLYGLYPKYGFYIIPLITLHSMTTHACVSSLVRSQKGTLADDLSRQIWPVIVNVFSPWISPYFTAKLMEPTPPWVQQLMDDRSVLSPWVPADEAIAYKMINSFIDCVKFVLHIMPTSSLILNDLFQWYVSLYAHQCIKEHVYKILHENLINLPWSRFQPTLSDVELLLKVVDQYLPSCHSLIGCIFMEISWPKVIQKEPEESARIHALLLNLLIKLANEPNLRQTGTVEVLLMEAKNFSWHLVDAPNYEIVINWFVMSYDPTVMLSLTSDDYNGIDMAAFRLLETASGYVRDNVMLHKTTTQKRQIFLKACVKMILNLSSRYSTILIRQRHKLVIALTNMLDQLESVITHNAATNDTLYECELLLSEMLTLANQPSGGIICKSCMQVIETWIKYRSAKSIVLRAFIHASPNAIVDHYQLALVLETSLTAWFRNSDEIEDCDWEGLLSITQPIVANNQPIEDILLSRNQLLTLYALVLKHITQKTEKITLARLISWITTLKPTTENESKLVLLWSLAFKVYASEKDKGDLLLMEFANYTNNLACMKQGGGILGVLGFSKQTAPSTKCKILCLAIYCFITSRLEGDGQEVKPEENDTLIDHVGKENSPENEEYYNGKMVNALESLLNDKQHLDHRVIIISAISLIKSKNVTLLNGEQFVITLAKQLYTDGFIHAFSTSYDLPL